MKGKALRRALETPTTALRIGAPIVLITDTTELVTPETAREFLQHNQSNRPINWKKVEEYAETMRRGEWELHAQGIVLDTNGNILTGQKRLWAVVYSGVNVYMRISRGSPSSVAKLLDRGTPQTSRDLAARGSGRKHSPTEASLARAYSALMGNPKPSVDQLATIIEVNAPQAKTLLEETIRVKKSKAVIMILAAILVEYDQADVVHRIAATVEQLAARLESALLPQTIAQCWGRGAAFGLSMEIARKIVRD